MSIAEAYKWGSIGGGATTELSGGVESKGTQTI